MGLGGGERRGEEGRRYGTELTKVERVNGAEKEGRKYKRNTGLKVLMWRQLLHCQCMSHLPHPLATTWLKGESKQ